jgi:hypothetical protein
MNNNKVGLSRLPRLTGSKCEFIQRTQHKTMWTIGNWSRGSFAGQRNMEHSYFIILLWYARQDLISSLLFLWVSVLVPVCTFLLCGFQFNIILLQIQISNILILTCLSSVLWLQTIKIYYISRTISACAQHFISESPLFRSVHLHIPGIWLTEVALPAKPA